MTQNDSVPHTDCTIVWFRDDLRIADNPALLAAERRSAPTLAVYVLDEDSDGIRPLGAASRWWLHHSLESLGRSLARLGVPLLLRRGPAADVVPDLARVARAGAVYWNRRYGGPEISVDKAVKTTLRDEGRTVESFAARLLHEPWALKPASGPGYKVFTPFWKAARQSGDPRNPLPAPQRMSGARVEVASDWLADWALLPSAPDWSGGLAETWTPGEDGARNRLERFLDEAIGSYARERDRPDIDATSMLSPHLRFGEISPHQVWHAVHGFRTGESANKFLSEIGWREFSWHILFHTPDLAERNFSAKFDAFPWRNDPDGLKAWQRGRTGYPIVDAGMRQLWTTGWMHNRVRMVAASFLVKHLLIDWRQGERWFWDTLVDADAANNPSGWQWVAGSGADAAPYFRVFNPTLQGEKFDPDGAYVRHWVPELAGLPTKHIHAPWTAPERVLRDAGMELGATYPEPVVPHAQARERALASFRSLKD
mgnify:CR=1 FL=1